MEKSTNVTPTLFDRTYAHAAINEFLKHHEPNDVSRNLRVVLLHALGNVELLEREEFFDLMHDIKGLFDLMDDVTLTVAPRKD